MTDALDSISAAVCIACGVYSTVQTVLSANGGESPGIAPLGILTGFGGAAYFLFELSR